MGGVVECIKILAPLSSENAINEAMRNAAAHGHLDCVVQLLPMANMQIDDYRAMEGAARHGHLDCLKLLWPNSHPEDKGVRAMAGAVHSNQHGCIDYLFEQAPREVCQTLRERIADKKGLMSRPGCQYFLTLCQAQDMKNHLHNVLGDTHISQRGLRKI